MKRLTLTVALLLCLVLCVFAFASCDKHKKKDQTTTEKQDETPSVTESKWPGIGKEVSAFAEEDRKIRIQYDMSTNNGEKVATNDKYIQGPDAISNETAKIDQKVYHRNKDARELLGLTIEYDYWNGTDVTWGKQARKIRELVEANDSTAPDLFIDMLYDLNNAMTSLGVFKDVKSLPGSYFDFSTDGWMKEWMDSLSFTGDRAYILGSDYFLDILRAMGVLPFNMDLMDANASKLAPALFNESLAAGETMSQRFFDFVEDEKWTWDALGKLCEAVHVDRGTVGQNDFDDVLGILVDKYSGLQSSLIVYSTGVPLIEVAPIEDPSSEYNGKNWANYYPDSSLLGDIFDAVSGVFKGNGAFVTSFTPDSGKGFADHYAKFAENTLLFAGPAVLAALEDDEFQQMEYTWSVVPLPKTSVDKEYNTMIHNIADAGAINVRTTAGKARALSAYLQYCTEHSADIKEEFLQTVTKYKTTTYNQGTDRMLDLIYDHIITGRDKALEDAAEKTSGKTSSAWMKEQKFVGDSSFVVTAYQSYLSEKQAKLDDVYKKWYTLPTAATEGDMEWAEPEPADASAQQQ